MVEGLREKGGEIGRKRKNKGNVVDQGWSGEGVLSQDKIKEETMLLVAVIPRGGMHAG